MTWSSAALGDICNIEVGKTPSRAEPEFWRSGTLPWLSIADMNQGRVLTSTKESVTEAGAKAARMKLVAPGTLLLSFKLSLGKVGIANIPLFTNEAIAALTDLRSDVHTDYMYWALRNADFLGGSDRAAMGNTLNKAKLKEIRIPLPPLPEQRRIAAILDKADALRAKRREAIAKLDQLLQSVFLEMFGDPVTNPKGWPECAISDVTSCIVPGRDKPKSFTGGIPWVTTEDLVNLGTTFVSKKGLGLSGSECEAVRAKVAPKDSVLMSCVGNLGITSLAGVDMVVNQQLHSFQCKGSVLPEFLMHCISYQEHYMQSRASSTTIPYMNKAVCNGIPVFVPPMQKQEEFRGVCRALSDQASWADKSVKALERLQKSLTQQVFGD